MQSSHSGVFLMLYKKSFVVVVVVVVVSDGEDLQVCCPGVRGC